MNSLQSEQNPKCNTVGIVCITEKVCCFVKFHLINYRYLSSLCVAYFVFLVKKIQLVVLFMYVVVDHSPKSTGSSLQIFKNINLIIITGTCRAVAEERQRHHLFQLSELSYKMLSPFRHLVWFIGSVIKTCRSVNQVVHPHFNKRGSGIFASFCCEHEGGKKGRCETLPFVTHKGVATCNRSRSLVLTCNLEYYAITVKL